MATDGEPHDGFDAAPKASTRRETIARIEAEIEAGKK
jgi:hypothetical protein